MSDRINTPQQKINRRPPLQEIKINRGPPLQEIKIKRGPPLQEIKIKRFRPQKPCPPSCILMEQPLVNGRPQKKFIFSNAADFCDFGAKFCYYESCKTLTLVI